jgi:hypothetical protein
MVDLAPESGGQHNEAGIIAQSGKKSAHRPMNNFYNDLSK